MGKCPSPDPGLNCPCVGFCPYGEPCLEDESEDESEDEVNGLTPEEANAWTSEMIRIVTGTIHELVKAADNHNIDRDSAIQYFSDLFSTMKDIATFERFRIGGEADGKG